MQSVHLRKYGASATINFDLFEVDGINLRVDAVHAAGDSKIMKDEADEASTTNSFTDEGNGYSLVLTATEMQAARIVIYLIDQTATKVWLDHAIVLETYGNASAQHAFDLDTVSIAQTGDSFARIGATGSGLTTLATQTLLTTVAGYIDTEVQAIIDELANGTDGLGALKALLDTLTTNVATVDTVADGIQTDLSNGTDGLSALKALLDAIPTTAMRGTDEANTTVPDAAGVAASLIGALNNFDPATETVDIGKISGSATAADNLEASTEVIVIGAATGTPSTTEMTTNLSETTDDHYNGRIIIWTSGVLKDQATDITDYVGATKKLVYTATTEAPSASDTFVVI
jgi:hypothetical protein